MATTEVPQVRWLEQTEKHDYGAAESYLALIAPPKVVAKLVKALKAGKPTHFKAKDILRAADLDLLALDNPHVLSDLRKVVQGKPLSPVLLVCGDVTRGVPAQIADGYHRVCASYHIDENTDIPVTIVGLETD